MKNKLFTLNISKGILGKKLVSNLITVVIIGIINFYVSKYISKRNANNVSAVESMIIVRMANISVK